jgi:hypothetical protein
VCPSCLGRRMNEGALNLVDHALPEVPLRQFVVTVPFPLRFPLAFDGALLGQVVRIFVDTISAWHGRRHALRGLPLGETGAVALIQRANSDLRLNPHVHAICLDGVYSADREGKGLMFHPAPAQEEIESLVGRAFGFEIVCTKCQSPLRLIALIKSEDIAKKILTAMHLPAAVPELHPARPPPQETGGGSDDWVN